MGSLASLFGAGGGGSTSPSSSTAQSSPFYNESGIYFNSPGAGTLTAGPVSADASPPNSRQTLGGNNALYDSTIPALNSSLPVSPSILYIAGALLLVLLAGIFLIKK